MNIKRFFVICLIDLTIGIPKDILGKNNPSMTSQWNQSALILSIFLQSLARMPKSAASMDGAILIDIMFDYVAKMSIIN